MSRLIARIMLSIFMLPIGAMVYLVCCVMGFRFFQNISGYRNTQHVTFCMAGATTWSVLAAYWILLWYRSVEWPTWRVQRTFVSAVVCLIVGLVVGSVINGVEDGFGTFVGSVTAPLLWLVCTTLIWRETAAERMKRVQSVSRDQIVCPTCGYNLTGLTATRCPECGSQFTLDELLASQPSPRVDAEVE